MEEIEKKRKRSSYEVNRLTDLFANFAEKLNDLKENNERDSGKHDTPLLKLKSALQQIKTESFSFDIRIGVVNHSLYVAKVKDSDRQRSASIMKMRKRNNKSAGKNRDSQHGDSSDED